MLETSWCSSWSVSLAHSAAYSVDYDLFMEGTTQEGGSQLAVGEQEGKSWQDRIDGGNAEETGDRDTHLKTPWHTRMRGEGRLRGCKIARHLVKINISKYFKLFQTMALNLSSGLSFHSFYWRIFFFILGGFIRQGLPSEQLVSEKMQRISDFGWKLSLSWLNFL